MINGVYAVRSAFVFCCLSGFAAAVIAWYHHLMVDRHEELSAKARRIYTVTLTRRGERGKVYDCQGNLLVASRNCIDVLVEPRKIPPMERERVIRSLSEQFDVPVPVLKKRFGSGKVEVVVKRHVPYAKLRYLQSLSLPGLRYVDSQVRYYPKGQLASTVLGLCSDTGRGISGIEAVCEKWLQPRKGKIVVERDRFGHLRVDAGKLKTRHLNGYHVILTISEPIQEIVEHYLAELVQQWNPRQAHIILAQPKTGAIMALAQYPSFDPNNRKHLRPGQWQMLAATTVYHPGSTMKPIALSGALDFGIVSIDDVVYCEKGNWLYGGRFLRDSGHHFEDLYVWQIIQKSSNIGTAKIALRMGNQRLYQTFRRFGLGEKTGIEVPVESKGLLPPPARWDKLSITRFPIGQGLAVTPLQMVRAYCALANGGVLPRLHLIEKVVEPNTGEVVFHHTPPAKQRRAAQKESIEKIVKAMMKVVSRDGTAPRAAVSGYHVAGKTGTSQKWDPRVNGYEGSKLYVASFIGFVPAERPAFVLLVVADEPKGAHYGGTVCAPYFSKISEEVLRFLHVRQDTAMTEGGQYRD